MERKCSTGREGRGVRGRSSEDCGGLVAISVALHLINKAGLLPRLDLCSHPNRMHQSLFLNPDYETAKTSRNIGEF
jgi:hypothetical protein